jgi:hypothetical protein
MMPTEGPMEIGSRIGSVVIIGQKYTVGGKRVFNKVRCDCGKEWDARRDALRSGQITSCGCKRTERFIAQNTKHGMTSRAGVPPEYTTWADMIQRCHNENSAAYKYYGARGIAVCDRWKTSFKNFYDDMGPRPSGTSIERINNDLGYEPGNCRWATHAEQMQNTRGTRKVLVSGREMSTSEAAKAIGVPRMRIYWRVHKYRITHQEAVDFYAAQRGA